MSDFCEAEHPNTNVGCYANAGHEGKHWSYSDYVKDRTGETQNEHGNMIWEWDGAAPEVPAGSATLVLSDAELGILIVALQPGSHFFPDLNAKLIAARESIK